MTIVPVYVVANFVMAVARLYAMLTLNRQDWLTRGAQKRPRSFAMILAWVATCGIIAGLAMIVYYYR